MASAMASFTPLTSVVSRVSQAREQSNLQQSTQLPVSSEKSSATSLPRDLAPQLTSRRQAALSLAGLSMALLAASRSRAEAKDVPLFGIRKKMEAVEESVVEGVEELVKEGEAEVVAIGSAVAGGFGSSASSAASSEGGLTPAVQAGVVAAAELVAVVAASSVVSGLVSQPSK